VFARLDEPERGLPESTFDNHTLDEKEQSQANHEDGFDMWTLLLGLD
jgi:hypothetical protein